MGEIIYNKLIRDKIVQIIENSGKQAIVRTASDEEYIKALNEKLGEELAEYQESESLEELADLVEVIYAILDFKGVSLEEFESIRLKKSGERGAFKDRVVLEKVLSFL